MTGVAYLQPFLLGLSANQLTKIVEIFPYTSVADTRVLYKQEALGCQAKTARFSARSQVTSLLQSILHNALAY